VKRCSATPCPRDRSMLLARRPSAEHIDRFLRESQDLPLSYSPIGIVNADTVRDDLDEATVTIGHGKAEFERARAALRSSTESARVPGPKLRSPESASQSCACFKHDSEITQPPR
jgi:hypothetical protein